MTDTPTPPSLPAAVLTPLVVLALLSAPGAAQHSDHASQPAPASAAGGCLAGWIDSFAADPGTDGQVQDLQVFDDGSGPALYVAGAFTSAGSVLARSIARWDGVSWSEVGEGLEGVVYALEVYDDGRGGGPALYAGGSFVLSGQTTVNRIARWDGGTWSAVGTGLDNQVYDLEVFDGELYAGGLFFNAGGTPANRIARWNGQDWQSLGPGTPGSVHALHVHDNGGGPALYVGGWWSATPGFPHDNLARWDGASWSDVGGGVSSIVWDLVTYPFDGEPALFASGTFTSAGGVPVGGIAAFAGGSWSAPLTAFGVEDMSVGDLGDGETLFMAGTIADGAAAWDGSTLTALGDLGNFAHCIEVFTIDVEPQLAVGGDFDDGFNVDGLNHVAFWNAGDWVPVGGYGFAETVEAVIGWDDGSGHALYVGGRFGEAYAGGGQGLARWKDGVWDDLGGTVAQPILDFAVHDDGSGQQLFACGKIDHPSLPVLGDPDVVRWDGSGWTLVGDAAGAGIVYDLHVHDDGSGPALYAGGSFTAISGVAADRIARWDGSSWAPLGAGPGGTVLAMASYDDGSGPALYVGGTFHTGAGGVADYVARWDGSSWSDLGSGPVIASGNAVRALEVGTFFGESLLYVGGTFAGIAGVPETEGLATYGGAGWSGLAFSGFTGSVHALQMYGDGAFPEPAMVVGGAFRGLGLFELENLAAWTGFGWSAFDGGVNGRVATLGLYDADDGLGPTLVAGGDFTLQYGVDQRDARLARWGGCWAGTDNWTDLGFALAGTAGDPLLVGAGSLAPASLNDVDLLNAYPSALAALFLSFSSTPTPFMGGTLIPVPWVDPVIYVTTSPLGSLPITFAMPTGVPSGTQLFVQWAIADPGGPNGAALSNALRGDVP